MNLITVKIENDDSNNIQKYLRTSFTDIKIYLTPDDVLVRDAFVKVFLQLISELKYHQKVS